MSDEGNLARCPFCGGLPVYYFHDSYDTEWWVKCDNDQCEVTLWAAGDDKAEARVSEKPPQVFKNAAPQPPGDQEHSALGETPSGSAPAAVAATVAAIAQVLPLPPQPETVTTTTHHIADAGKMVSSERASVPDAAVDRAINVYQGLFASGAATTERRRAMRAAIESALPMLVPSATKATPIAFCPACEKEWSPSVDSTGAK